MFSVPVNTRTCSGVKLDLELQFGFAPYLHRMRTQFR